MVLTVLGEFKPQNKPMIELSIIVLQLYKSISSLSSNGSHRRRGRGLVVELGKTYYNPASISHGHYRNDDEEDDHVLESMK